MSQPTAYQTAMKTAEERYGRQGVYAFEALCLTSQQIEELSPTELDVRIQHALQDMGQP